jgi:hypothetical protein
MLLASTRGPTLEGPAPVPVSVSSFDVELRPTLDGDGAVHARITPVPDVVKAISESRLSLPDAVFDVVSDLIVELVKKDVEHGGAEVLE